MKKNLKKLIIVACHAICMIPRNPLSIRSWTGTYGYPEEAALYTQHIQHAVAIAAVDPTAMVVFSGGITRVGAPLSESASYLGVAKQAALWGANPSTLARLWVEENARDSFYNCLYSICLFKEVNGYYPESIAVIGMDFKRTRFGLHMSSLGWNKPYQYFGFNNPPERDGILDQAEQGERNVMKELMDDPFVRSKYFQEKRKKRNPCNLPDPEFKAIQELYDYARFVRGEGTHVIAPWS